MSAQDRHNSPSSRSNSARLILQHVARRSLEDTDSRDGWCRWSTSDDWPWEWHDYKPLVERGWLERRETWKDVLLKLTPTGWLMLNSAPATLLPEPRRDVKGQPIDGDVLP